MKFNWSRNVLLFCTCMMCIGLTGCGEKTENSEILSIDTIKNIVIKTGDNDIIVENTDTDEIKASIVGYEGVLFAQNGDTVRLEIPMSKGGVHLSELQPLYIYLPGNKVDFFTAESEYGNIQIESVITNITARAEYGSITAFGLEGTLTAKTQSGEIKSDNIPAADIIRGINDIGASYSGMLGNSATEYELDLFSEYGNIEVNGFSTTP